MEFAENEDYGFWSGSSGDSFEYDGFESRNPVDPEFFYAMNHRKSDVDKHTVMSISSNIHLTGLARIGDMGKGVLVVEIPNIPVNDINRITRKFKKLACDPFLFVDYNHRSIEIKKLRRTCMGPGDCSIGLYSTGSGAIDRYSIVVRSFSIQASTVFNAGVLETLKNIREICEREKVSFPEICQSPIVGPEFLTGSYYEKTMKKSLLHRLAVARYIFEECEICIPDNFVQEKDLGENSRDGGFRGHEASSSRSGEYDGAKSLLGGKKNQRFSGRYYAPRGFKCSLKKREDKSEEMGEVFQTEDESSVEHPSIWQRFGHGLGLVNSSRPRKKDVCSDGYDSSAVSFSNPGEHDASYSRAVSQYVSVFENEDFCRDYPIVFLKLNGTSKSLLLFNHVYEPLSLHEGAPFFGSPTAGFYTYQVDPNSLRELRPNLQHIGAPISVPFIREEVEDTILDEECIDDVVEKVKWLSQISIAYIANPSFYRNLDEEMCEVEKSFILGHHSCLWRCIYTIYSPPDEKNLTLEDFSNFGQEQVLQLPIETWETLFGRYMYVFREWEGRIKLDGVTEKTLDDFPPSDIREEDAHPKFKKILTFDSFPPFTELFNVQPRTRLVHASYRRTKEHKSLLEKEMLSKAAIPTSLNPVKEEEAESMNVPIDKGSLCVERENLAYLLKIFQFFFYEKPKPSSLEYREKESYVNGEVYTDTDVSSSAEFDEMRSRGRISNVSMRRSREKSTDPPPVSPFAVKDEIKLGSGSDDSLSIIGVPPKQLKPIDSEGNCIEDETTKRGSVSMTLRDDSDEDPGEPDTPD